MAKKTYAGDRTTCIPRELLKSPAYLSLTTGAAHIVLMTFMLKRQMHEEKHPKRNSTWVVKNNGAIVYTYEEAKRQGFNPKRFRDALDLLLERGFISIAKTGNGKHKRKTFYALSDGWKTWVSGTPPKEKRRIRKSSKHPIGFQPGNKLWQKRNS